MRFFRFSVPRQFRLLMLVMASLLFAPFASLGAMADPAMDASDKVCETGQTAQMEADCCDQASSTDCQTHCLDLMLSHVPVSAVPAFGSLPFPAVAQTVRQTTRHMSGISSLPDPRPPRI